jgi:hypothetical protein
MLAEEILASFSVSDVRFSQSAAAETMGDPIAIIRTRALI